MSADSFIPLAIAGAFFIAAPIALAGIAVAGAAVAVSVVAQAAADASRKAAAEQASRQHEQQARLARQSTEDQQAIRALQSRYTALQSRQRAAADELSQNIAQAAQKVARELHASGKATAENAASLQRTAQAKAEALSHKWSTQNDALLAQYSADLHASFQETRTQLEARKADLSRLHSTLAGDDAQTRLFAQEQLDAARIAIQSFEVEFGHSPAAEDYHRAVEYFNGGLYENAHSLASAVALDVYTQLEKALVQQAKDDFLRTAIYTMVRTGQARIHALENCTVPYQGVEYNEDLTRFLPDVFAALKTRLQQQEQALESASSAELAKARTDVSELLQDVDCAARTAARQMIYAYSENDSGELVQGAMFQQGYTCTGYAYNVAVYTNTKAVAQQLKTAKQPAAFEKQHRAELTQYRAAAAYFKANNITKLPSLKKLEAEYEQLASERARFYEQYKEAKTELLKLQTARQNVASYFREEKQTQQER